MTGGAFKNNSNLLGRRREIDELQNSVEMLKKDLEEKQAELDGYREKRNHFRDEVARLGELLQEQYLRDNTVRMNLQSMSAKKQEIADSYESLKRENAELEKQVAEISENSDPSVWSWRRALPRKRLWRMPSPGIRKSWMRRKSWSQSAPKVWNRHILRLQTSRQSGDFWRKTCQG